MTLDSTERNKLERRLVVRPGFKMLVEDYDFGDDDVTRAPSAAVGSEAVCASCADRLWPTTKM